MEIELMKQRKFRSTLEQRYERSHYGVLKYISTICDEYNKLKNKSPFRDAVKKRLSKITGGIWENDRLFLEIDIDIKEWEDETITPQWAGKKVDSTARNLFDLQNCYLRPPMMSPTKMKVWILRHISPQGDAKGIFDDLSVNEDWPYLPIKENQMGTVEYTFRLDPIREFSHTVDENQGYEWEAYKKIEFNTPCATDAISSIDFESISGNSAYEIRHVWQPKHGFEVIITKSVSMASILELAELTEMSRDDLLALLIKQDSIEQPPHWRVVIPCEDEISKED